MQPAHDPAGLEDGPCSARSLLARLLSSLDAAGRGDTEANPDDSRLARWEDEDYLYFEVTLPAHGLRDVDIAVHDGRVLIRIER